MTSTVAGVSRTVRPRSDALSAGDVVLSGVWSESLTCTSGNVVCAKAGAARAANIAVTDNGIRRLVRQDAAFLIKAPLYRSQRHRCCSRRALFTENVPIIDKR